MVDINKQIQYWKDGAFSDLKTADILIEENRFLHGLFFCHLSIEKILKALVVQQTKDLAPKTHNLLLLLSRTTVSIDDADNRFLGILMKYQLEGRYPDYDPALLTRNQAKEYFAKTKELLECFTKKL